MTRADNSHLLAEAARARSEQARRRTLEAVASLAASGAAVTPTAVARQAGVSRQWLYRFEDAFDAIRAANAACTPTNEAVPATERASVRSLQRRLEAVADENKRLRSRVTDLEQRLAAVYGEWRARGLPSPADASRSSMGADW